MESRVIVICEECGRKYRVNPNRILGLAAGFRCRSCGHDIRVLKPTAPLPARPQGADATPGALPARPAFRRTGIALRAQAWLIWGVAPGLALAAAGWLLTGGGGELRGLGDESVPLHLPLVAGGLVVTLAGGLAFGLRLIGRIVRLAEAIDHLGSGGGGPTTPPDSGDDLDRLAAALGDAAKRLASRHRESPP